MERKLENIVGRRIGTMDKEKCLLTRLCIVRIWEIDISDLSELLLHDLAKSFIIAIKLSGTRHTMRSAEINAETAGIIKVNEEWRIQYQHALKNTEVNNLRVMLQRRKTYKKRKILGFKTIVSQVISMDEVYHRGIDCKISLISNNTNERPVKLGLTVSSSLCRTLNSNEEEENFEKISNFRQHKLMRKLVKIVTKQRGHSTVTADDHNSHEIQMIINELDELSSFPSVSASLRPQLKPLVFHSSSSSIKSTSSDSSTTCPPSPYQLPEQNSSLLSHQAVPSSIVIFQESTDFNESVLSEHFPQFDLIIELAQQQVDSFLADLVRRIQQKCDRSVEDPDRVRIALFVSESFLASFIRSYVSILSPKAVIWTSIFVFYFIPTGDSHIARVLASHDDVYSDCILDSSTSPEFLVKAKNYLSQTMNIVRLPVAEVMIPEQSDQVFPLVAELSLNFASEQSSSDDATGHETPGRMKSAKLFEEGKLSEATSLHLHVDISFDENKNDMNERLEKLLKKDGGKYSMKINVTYFVVRNKLVDNNSLSLEFVLADKKPMIRLNRPRENKQKLSYKIYGVTRIVCKSRANAEFNVCIDNLETPNVTFMSISSQWRTNVKNFPFVVFSVNK